MALFYSDNREPFKGRPGDFAKYPATAKYLEHYANYIILDRILQAPKDLAERGQAAKELTLCEKKLAYWTRHPNFVRAEAERGVAKLKALWA